MEKEIIKAIRIESKIPLASDVGYKDLIKFVKENEWNKDHAFKYFCNQNCLYQFINTHLEEIVRIAPRREALETPIKDPVKDSSRYYNQWTIEEKT